MPFDKQTHEDLLVTALEGGSNYWYFLPNLEMISKDDALPLSQKILEYLYENKEEQISVWDIESEDGEEEVIGYISYDNFLKADQLMEKDYPVDYDMIVSEDWDAATADVWFQLVVMSEIVFG